VHRQLIHFCAAKAGRTLATQFDVNVLDISYTRIAQQMPAARLVKIIELKAALRRPRQNVRALSNAHRRKPMALQFGD